MERRGTGAAGGVGSGDAGIAGVEHEVAVGEQGEGREAGARVERQRAGEEGPMSEMLADILGKLWRRGRLEVEKAARKGRERLTLRHHRADRDRMYMKLGKEARQLLEAGELDHPGIRRGIERIRELEAKLLEAEDAVRARGGDPAEDAGQEAGEGTASDVDAPAPGTDR